MKHVIILYLMTRTRGYLFIDFSDLESLHKVILTSVGLMVLLLGQCKGPLPPAPPLSHHLLQVAGDHGPIHPLQVAHVSQRMRIKNIILNMV